MSRSVDAALQFGPTIVRGIGLSCGLVVALLRWYGHLPSLYEHNEDWCWDAFASLGTMSGFSLASLAIVAGLAGHERARQTLEQEEGRWLVRQLILAMTLWLIPAILGLVAALAPQDAGLQAAVIGFASLAISQAVVAVAAINAFFRRFSKPRPE